MSMSMLVRILSQPLTASLTRAQAILACDVRTLYAAATALAAGRQPAEAQLLAFQAVREILSSDPAELVVHPAAEPDIAPTAPEASAIAEAAAVEKRRLLASTVANTLMAASWTVTVVAGGAADRFTGVEATRGTEHLIAAVSHSEIIADQAGAQGRGAVDLIVEGLRETGCFVTLADGPGENPGGTLYALRGGPSLAHAVQALLRYEPGSSGKVGCGPPLLTAG